MAMNGDELSWPIDFRLRPESRPGKPEMIDGNHRRELCTRQRPAGGHTQNIPRAFGLFVIDNPIFQRERQRLPIDHP